MKKLTAAAFLALLSAFMANPARGDDLYMISDAQGQATFDSESNQPGGYDLSGYTMAAVQVSGVGGTVVGTVSIQWRATVNDQWKEIGSFTNPGICDASTATMLCSGMYGPGVGLLKAVLTYGGPGTARVTLRRTK